MAKSPGHQKWPDYTVRDEPVDQEMEVKVNGEVIADSDHVIKVVEDKHPDRYYFPREDVQMDHLDASGRDTECPFKGHGEYFDVNAGGDTVDDAAWSYEDTYDEHRDLQDRIAFHANEMDAVEVTPVG